MVHMRLAKCWARRRHDRHGFGATMTHGKMPHDGIMFHASIMFHSMADFMKAHQEAIECSPAVGTGIEKYFSFVPIKPPIRGDGRKSCDPC